MPSSVVSAALALGLIFAILGFAVPAVVVGVLAFVAECGFFYLAGRDV